MRVLLHDFAGHPFQFQLSRELVRRGHDVMHAYFADLPGPKGKLCAEDDDAVRLDVEGIRIGARFERYSYFQRLWAHQYYVRMLLAKLKAFRPDVVISGNAPTDVQYQLSRECKKNGMRFVHWIQDFYALALETLLTRRFGGLGRVCAAPFHLLERRIFNSCDAAVYISDDFPRYAAAAGYRPKASVVIENWASLAELPRRLKANDWSRAHNLEEKLVFLYSGTMGLKHNPHMLAELAEKFRNRPDVRVVLVSDGIGRRVLEEIKRDQKLDNLVLLDFQPYEALPDVLATADVLLASVEPDSSVFCVPSKILSYLCAGRPILMSVPDQNLASRIVERAGAGYVCNPGDAAKFLERAEHLVSSPATVAQMGENARRYAELNFDIDRICDLFEQVLRDGALDIVAIPGPLTARAPS